MPEIGMHEAKTTLSQLVERAERGEEIIITRNGTPAARLTAIPKPNGMASIRGALKARPAVFAVDFDEIADEMVEGFRIPPDRR
jgi:prevent-host-death family protein